MPKSVRKYLVSENQIRVIFLVAAAGAIAVLVLLLFMISAMPEGEYEVLDDSMYERTVAQAAEALSGYDRDPDTGAISIPIERAMQLVVERGVNDIQFGQVQTEEQAPAEGQATQPQTEADGGGAGFDWQALGESAYNTCAGCHQANGQGIPGAFPPLAGHLPEIAQVEGGRSYLINVVLYGLQGEISVDGQSYNGVMPAFGGQFSNEQVAAVLNHELTSWGNAEAFESFEPILPEDVAEQRDQGLSPQEVYAIRQELGLE